jgi:ABC-2 type transport system permease protein
MILHEVVLASHETESKEDKPNEIHEEILERVNKSGLRKSIHSITTYAIKNLKHSLRYPGSWLYWMLVPMLWLVPYAFQGKALIEGTESEFFRQFGGTGDYFSYIAIGIILFNIVDAAIWGSGNRLRWEQKSGTFEFLWMSPVSRSELLLGASLSELGWIVFVCTGQFLILNFMLSWSFTIIQVLLAMLVILVTLIGLFGFSFLFASIILVFKEPGTLTELTEASLNILLPVRYPLQVLPTYIRWVGYIIPFAYGFLSFRAFTIAYNLRLGALYISLLLLLSVIMWIAGVKLFSKIERRTRSTGQLGAY